MEEGIADCDEGLVEEGIAALEEGLVEEAFARRFRGVMAGRGDTCSNNITICENNR